MQNQAKHIWNFSLVGGVKRVNFESGRDLLELKNLDQKLWTALSCPVSNLEIDPKTLDLIDADKNGQIRVKDILTAVDWITHVIKNPDNLLKEESEMPLSAINTDHDDGRILLASAKIILKNLGKGNAEHISVEDTADLVSVFANTQFNGDGVITEDSTPDFILKQIIVQAMTCVGSVPDRGGKEGLNAELLNSFFENCKLYDAWLSKAENEAETILPFGKNTAEAYANFMELQPKFDDFFLRCKLADFDVQSAVHLNTLLPKMELIGHQNLTAFVEDIAAFPIAKTNASHILSLVTGVNPHWQLAVEVFHQLIVEQKSEVLTESDWTVIKNKFAPYQQWLSEKAGAVVEPLGLDYIREVLRMNADALLADLIEQDKALEHEANNIILVDQMVRYYRDIFTLLKNFVTFYDFYTKGKKAIFQAGTLYIDQRSCDLCIKVQDMDKHNEIAGLSGLFLVYCACKSRSTDESMIIAAALTNGDIDNVEVGRNGLFYDRDGNDWDATIIKLIENPISIQQSFWMPYRRVSKFVGSQVNKFASSQDSKVQEKTTTSVEKARDKADEELNKNISSSANPPAASPTLVAKADPPAPAASAPFDVGKFVGIFAAISLALGAIGTAIASVLSGFLALAWWQIPLAIFGVLMAISGPAMILAYIKLRKRNLAPLLDANGWAINANVIINITFGNALTSIAQLPVGAKVNLDDPFTKKKMPFLKTIIAAAILLVIAFYFMWKYNIFYTWHQ